MRNVFSEEEIQQLVKRFGIQPNRDSTVTDCMRHRYKLLGWLVAGIAGLAFISIVLNFLPFLAICGSMFVIVVIVYLDAGRHVRSNVEINTKRRHAVMLMLIELTQMLHIFEHGNKKAYTDEKGSVGFVDEILTYDWCDTMSTHNDTSFHLAVLQVQVHDVVNLARDHNYYRQKLEDVIIPNRTNGTLPEKEASDIRSYCVELQQLEAELVRVLVEILGKGQDVINVISANLCKSPDAIPA